MEKKLTLRIMLYFALAVFVLSLAPVKSLEAKTPVTSLATVKGGRNITGFAATIKKSNKAYWLSAGLPCKDAHYKDRRLKKISIRKNKLILWGRMNKSKTIYGKSKRLANKRRVIRMTSKTKFYGMDDGKAYKISRKEGLELLKGSLGLSIKVKNQKALKICFTS